MTIVFFIGGLLADKDITSIMVNKIINKFITGILTVEYFLFFINMLDIRLSKFLILLGLVFFIICQSFINIIDSNCDTILSCKFDVTVMIKIVFRTFNIVSFVIVMLTILFLRIYVTLDFKGLAVILVLTFVKTILKHHHP